MNKCSDERPCTNCFSDQGECENKNNQCKGCVGLNLSELKRKAHMWDKAEDAEKMQFFLIRSGEFLMKAMDRLGGDNYVEAESKLADIVRKL